MKTFFRMLLVPALLVFLTTDSFCQTSTNFSANINPVLLKQDLNELIDSLKNLHASLYRYKSESEMNAVFEHCFQQINHTMTETDFFAIVSNLVSNIEDGHTECFLPQDVIKSVIANVKIFPIQPKLIGDKAFVPCDTREFSAGTEIIAIDGVPVNLIKKRLFGLLSSDGTIETEKYIKINNGHDPFSYLYYVVYGEKADFKVSYRTASGKPGEKTLHADYFPKMECAPPQANVNQYLTLEYKQNGLVIMTIKTFANDYLKRTKEDLEVFLAGSFKELKNKNIHKLIIDLRENGGGDDTNGSLLYRYLTDKPFYYYASLNTTKRTETDHPNLSIQQPEGDNFKGRVEFLIGGKSFSGAAEFAAVAKNNLRGVFIGEETGGGYYGNTSGSKKAIVLNNTKIRVNIPLTKYVMAVRKTKYRDRGIIPDYPIVPTIKDYIEHNDIQMNFAMKLLSGK
jgi:hypothetical protein